jgi:hypothetical protein
MITRGVIGTAILAYALVLGCVIWPAHAPAGKAATGPATDESTATSAARAATARSLLPLRGVAIQIQRVDWTDRYKQCIDEVAALGANAVSFVVDARQENGSSARIYLDMRMTPTPQMLGELIDHAKGRGLRVMLMPIVLLDAPRGEEWRGKIEPVKADDGVGGWESWWESYRSMITHFAWVAQGHDVDVLVVGSELVSTEDERHLPQWTRTIEQVRGVYTGLLTYSSNWDHYTSVKFWDQLDLIAMNSYWEFAPRSKWTPGAQDAVSVDEITRRWREIQSDLLPFVQEKGKPLLFTEVGWCSMANMAHEPWDYTKSEVPIDLDLQRRLYEGFFQSWHGHHDLGGFMIWDWTPGDGGPNDRGYTPENKPAGELLKRWMAKSWE